MSAEWDVAIVGCGPVGAYAANLLGQAGLKTLVLERDNSPYALPRAVHFDHEMVRLLADIGLLEPLSDRLLAADGHLHIGADKGMIRYLSAAGKPRPFGHANDYFFYQPELEDVLRKGLERYDNVTLRLGVEVVSLDQGPEQAVLGLANGETVTARWVIGTDGARSTVRKALGGQLDDLNFEEPWLVVDAEVEGPILFPKLTGVPETANLQRLSVMMCDPDRPTTVVPGRGNHRRWEFMLLPGEDDGQMADPKAVADLVAPWLKDTPHQIIRAATYRFHGLVAQDWHVGRTFLAGDAAHQTPPFFGQGMCHGMRDVANLVWKLVLVVQGKADEGLLETYQEERDAQVRHVIGKAIEAGKYICILDPDEAAARDARVRSQKDIATAAELIAPIVSPIVAANAGERFINPKVDADGKLLDDVIGSGWHVISLGEGFLSDDANACLDLLDATHWHVGPDVADCNGHLADWFEAKGAQFALIRPDFYLAAVGTNAREMSGKIIELASAMGLSNARAAA